ncbi:MAG: hypothetical protein EON54_25895 [Alcaligenaceae bacterium]|nr:MAG: hypothetical protein EON54_25895 [Alcaligenaceae bacterium]
MSDVSCLRKGRVPGDAARCRANTRTHDHTPNQLTQYFGALMAGRLENLPDPQPQIAISNAQEHFVKIGCDEGGFDVYRRATGDEWTEASLSDFDAAEHKGG